MNTQTQHSGRSCVNGFSAPLGTLFRIRRKGHGKFMIPWIRFNHTMTCFTILARARNRKKPGYAGSYGRITATPPWPNCNWQFSGHSPRTHPIQSGLPSIHPSRSRCAAGYLRWNKMKTMDFCCESWPGNDQSHVRCVIFRMAR